MDDNHLNTVGKILKKKDLQDDFAENKTLTDYLRLITSFLTKSPSKSVLITGESGIGKTSMILQVAKILVTRNWKVFQATANNVIAGQRYIGDVEQSVKDVITALFFY